MREGEPRNFVQPCLLLLLDERPDHGYELIERLRLLCGVDNDASGIYRALRNLERAGLVCSSWTTQTPGPARRMYHLTANGAAVLAESAATLTRTRASIDAFLHRYARRAENGSRSAAVYRLQR